MASVEEFLRHVPTMWVDADTLDGDGRVALRPRADVRTYRFGGTVVAATAVALLLAAVLPGSGGTVGRVLFLAAAAGAGWQAWRLLAVDDRVHAPPIAWARVDEDGELTDFVMDGASVVSPAQSEGLASIFGRLTGPR